ncbi:peptidylprolyl isomerase [Porticoccaceae bacterium]|nr:peptidylprolyl isomerase [Porticoccaceae bacterium]MDB2621243.1 peptidylprolyl isomerase [Porticoccaceae bacterium]
MPLLATQSGYIFRGIAAVAGLVLVLVGSKSEVNWHLNPSDTLVLVNQQPITQATLNTALVTLGLPKNPSTQHYILQRLVDDELILQRAEDLGILQADPGIRKLLARSAIENIVNDTKNLPVDKSALRAFYESHQAIFEESSRTTLKAFKFNTLEQASNARNHKLTGGQLDEIIGLIEGAQRVDIPLSPLPEHILRRYLGVDLSSKIIGLAEGEILKPIRQKNGVYLVQVLDVEPATVRDFELVRNEIATEIKSRARDRALKNELVRLKQAANIEVNTLMVDQLIITVN